MTTYSPHVLADLSCRSTYRREEIMNMPQAVFGGFAMIAAAILVGRVSANAGPAAATTYQLMTPFNAAQRSPNVGEIATPGVFVIDISAGKIRYCEAGTLRNQPLCSPWSAAS